MKKLFKNPEPGDKIEIIVKGKSHQGILLESHEQGVLLLKLRSGYNTGYKKEDIKEIKLLEKKQEKKKKKEKRISGKKPVIDFYLTGGTISSKLDPSTGGVKWLIDADELFSIYPEIFEIANIRVKSPFMKASENMDFRDWQRLSRMIGKSLNDSNVRGVIISHGTDFLHYTAGVLSFMLKNLNKPVVLTYSQRSSDRGSSDSRLNLKCSAYAALSDIAEVILVGHANLDDEYCYALQGNKCRKMHSSRRDTFRPINCKPVAKIFSNGNIDIIRDYKKRNKNKVEVDSVFDNKIALIKFYPGQSPDILDYYMKNKYKGIVIEMSGLGHVITEGENNWIPKLKEIIKKGILVFAAPQTLYGRLDPNVYSPGRKLQEIGVVFLEDILPETAFVKLGWVLGHELWRGSVMTKQKMLENINKEFNNRLDEGFLV
ncbi:Glu-tRNA(Gln) amidotransferase subunit GatD [Candidatus Pacearchaeota archaeon]|nr:Glu-tRNA(Gln) amidotransferase subunit GatD [Candidatus Pacearchaeota archaeon]MBD3283564.1 Glu-tRNA(Gln) amidotransferase subunit GatD [Candidatus Pacearchaeota archaeon]